MTSLILPRYLFKDDDTTIQATQEIPDDFLTECHENRVASTEGRMGEYHQFASIPTAVVDMWMRQGFNIYQEPMSAIVKRLRSEDLTAFLTTEKRL